MQAETHSVTQLLAAAGRGDPDAWSRLAPLIYTELKSLAEAAMRSERAGHTLQPTALVHEAFMRLAAQDRAAWNNRHHFLGAAAEAMRRVLVDHARRRLADKRGAGRPGATIDGLDATLLAFEQRSTDMLALDDALSRLATIDAQQARIVELRFFGGLTTEESADVLGVSPSTVERAWRIARAWLLRELSPR